MIASHHSYKMKNMFNTRILQGNYRRQNLEVLYSPKSANFNSPLSLMSRFCGLRSLQIKSLIFSDWINDESTVAKQIHKDWQLSTASTEWGGGGGGGGKELVGYI